MGFFDVDLKKELSAPKIESIDFLEKKLSPFSKEIKIEKNSLILKNFKLDRSLLQYDLKIDFTESKKCISLNIYGELLNLWILVILIVTGIMFTYGIGVIIIIAYTYYQKRVTSKYIESIINKLNKNMS